jgi:hypothetical protein
MAESIIEPRTAAGEPQDQNPAVDPTQEAPAAPEQDSGLPDSLLKVPAMQALMAGSPPALSSSIKSFEKNPVAKLIAENKNPLMQAGIGFYKSLNGDTGVIFNGLHIHPEDLQAADKMGKLTTIAPPFDSVDHAVSKSGLGNPVLKPKNVPQGPASPRLKAPPTIANTVPPGPAPQPAPAVKQATAGIQKAVLNQRGKNSAVGAPTTGPAPGAGRILNSILKPVV